MATELLSQRFREFRAELFAQPDGTNFDRIVDDVFCMRLFQTSCLVHLRADERVLMAGCRFASPAHALELDNG